MVDKKRSPLTWAQAAVSFFRPCRDILPVGCLQLARPRRIVISFQGLLQFVTSQLPQSEIIEQALRVKRTVYPETALRELEEVHINQGVRAQKA